MSTARKLAAIAVMGVFGSIAGMNIASAGGGGCHGAETEGRGTHIEMIDACFAPTTLFAEPGDTITFTNRDDFAHNVSANGWGYFEDLNGGETFRQSFADAGVYPFACTLHPGMTGAIVVGDGDDGSAVVAEAAPTPPTTPTDPDRTWMLAGLVGLVLGAGVASAVGTRRRVATTELEAGTG